MPFIFDEIFIWAVRLGAEGPALKFNFKKVLPIQKDRSG
jgi:hypothetical protein